MNIRFLASLVVVSAMPLLQAAEPQGQKTAIKLVKEAIAFGKANGKDKLFREVNMASGRFHVNSESSIYVSIYDLNGIVLGHGYTPAKVGTNRFQTKDPDGVAYVQEFIKLGREKGNGFVTYKHEDPATKKLSPKTSYVELWGDCVVTCGVHK